MSAPSLQPSGMNSQTVVLTKAGTSAPLFLASPFRLLQAGAVVASPMAPLLIVNLSAGAVLSYNIEIIGIQTQGGAGGIYPPGEPWNQADNASNLTANINYSVDAAVIAFRINVTSYISGTLTASLVQP